MKFCGKAKKDGWKVKADSKIMDLHPFVPTFKCLLLGDRGVGKTTFINRFQTGSFTNVSIKIIGAAIHPITLQTDRGIIKYNVWDFVENNNNASVLGKIYYQAQCAIIMFDVRSHMSYESLPLWFDRIHRYCGSIPVVVCGSKTESKCRGVLPKEILFHREKNIKYCEISALSNYNLEKPFLYLAVDLLSEYSVSLITIPKLAPAEVAIDLPFQEKIEEQIAQTMNDQLESIAEESDDDFAADSVTIGTKKSSSNQFSTRSPLRSNSSSTWSTSTKGTISRRKKKRSHGSCSSLGERIVRDSMHALTDSALLASKDALKVMALRIRQYHRPTVKSQKQKHRHVSKVMLL